MTLSTADELLRYAPLLLTVAGWWVVNKQHNKREARKEHRALVDAAKREIARIADDAISYFTDTMSSLDHRIVWSLDALEIELARLPERQEPAPRHVDGSPFDALIRFANACTGDQFQQKNRSRLDHTSEQIKAIHLCRNQLFAALEHHFLQVHE